MLAPRALTLAPAVLATSVLAILPAPSAGASARRARGARSLAVRDTAELHLLHAYGNTLIEEGAVKGTLPGRVRIKLDINATRNTASAQFTAYLRGGTISGGSSGAAHGGHNGWESFSGRMWVNHGTGAYRHASGSGHMYGSIYRRTDRLIVQQVGQLRY